MNYLKFNRMKTSFLDRRYAIRLGRRYAKAAANVILLGLLGYSKVNSIDSPVAQSLAPDQQELLTTGQVATPSE